MIKLTNKIYISKKAENQLQMEGESHGGNGRGMQRAWHAWRRGKK